MRSLGGEPVLCADQPGHHSLGATLEIAALQQIPPCGTTGWNLVVHDRGRLMNQNPVRPDVLSTDADLSLVTSVTQADAPDRVECLAAARHVAAEQVTHRRAVFGHPL